MNWMTSGLRTHLHCIHKTAELTVHYTKLLQRRSTFQKSTFGDQKPRLPSIVFQPRPPRGQTRMNHRFSRPESLLVRGHGKGASAQQGESHEL